MAQSDTLKIDEYIPLGGSSFEVLLKSRFNVIRCRGSSALIAAGASPLGYMGQAGLYLGLYSDLQSPAATDCYQWYFGEGDFTNGIEIINKKSGYYMSNMDVNNHSLTQSLHTTGSGENFFAHRRWKIYSTADQYFAFRPADDTVQSSVFPVVSQFDNRPQYPRGWLKIRMVGEATRKWTNWSIDAPQAANVPYDPLVLQAQSAAVSTIEAVLNGLQSAANSIPVIGSAASIVLKFVDQALTFLEALNSDQDPIQQLYNALLPEIEKIVTRVIDKALLRQSVTNALSYARTGSLWYSTAVQILKDTVTDQTKPITLENLGDAGAQFTDNINQSIQAYSLALGALQAIDDREVSFPVWLQTAQQYIAVYTTLAIHIAPNLYFAQCKALLETILDTGTSMRDNIYLGRQNKVIRGNQNIDTFYTAQNTIGMAWGPYADHLEKVAEITFGGPSRYLDQFQATLNNINSVASTYR
jgi:hypothetical protein